MTRRRPAQAGAHGAEGFFDRFRDTMARLPAGLIRVTPPAIPADLARAEAALGRPLPRAYADFLRSFDGADLFHESVIVAGVGPASARRLTELPQLRPGELTFAEAAVGDLYALDGEGRVLRYDAGAEERALAGSSFSRWLDATVAREQLLFDDDGEYAADVFDPSGQEVLPKIALRQAERALKIDPGAADWEHARALALARLARGAEALEGFRKATALDPENPWPWFDLGRTAMDLGQPAAALEAFRTAAERERGPSGARLCAWAARAAVAAEDVTNAEAMRREALARESGLVEGLTRAVEEATDEGDPEARAEALALLEAIAPGIVMRRPLRRLPMFEAHARADARPEGRADPAQAAAVNAPPPLRPRPAPPRRPRRGAPPRGGASRRGTPR